MSLTTVLQVGRSAACSDPLFVVADDDDVDNGTVVCGGRSRLTHVYLSTSNCLHLHLNVTADRTAEFLIYYEGVKLLSLITPPLCTSGAFPFC